jgi:topoisomerase IV subunit A
MATTGDLFSDLPSVSSTEGDSAGTSKPGSDIGVDKAVGASNIGDNINAVSGGGNGGGGGGGGDRGKASKDDGSGGDVSLADYAERAYLEYAVSVVKGRALPDVADGQKPVQRRILFAMNEMGLTATSKPVKSARVVGDVLGKYHPHGDVAAYDALVRMAQSFSLRYPLIDGQGNFGSRDGDGAAAMRYTEARLTKIAQLLLDEIDSGTVDFKPNYDGSQQEPVQLPARLPMVLLNGASGIAVGLATEIPSHNLREVAQAAIVVMRNPKASVDDILAVMPGPDYPGGAQIISPASDIREIYSGGRGSLKVRARYHFEDLARGQWQWVIDELPPGVSSQKVMEEIEEITNPKVKTGKKALSADQLQLKQNLLAVLDVARDESGKEAAVRLVFEPKTSKVDRDQFVNTLLSQTSLEASAPINLVSIGLDGRPGQKNLLGMLADWCQFRIQTVERRIRHRLGKVEDRIHILEGRQIILLNIDEVIRIIRESDEPKPALIAAFKLSDRQAEDILEIRLRQLARLETIKIEQELKTLRTEKAEIESLLANPSALKRLVIKEIEADAKTYGDDRRTLIESAARANAEIKLIEEPITVIVSEKGWVRVRQGHGVDVSALSFKSGDAYYGSYEVMSTDSVIAVGTNGRVYCLPVSQLPSARGDGQPITSFFEIESGTRIEHVFAAEENTGVMFTSRMGMGLLCQVKDLVARTRQGKSFFTLEEKDIACRPALFKPGMAKVLCMSTEGKALGLDVEEVKLLKNGGRGVIVMALDKGDTLAQALVYEDAFSAPSIRVEGVGRGAKPVDKTFTPRVLQEYLGGRARKGKYLEPRVKEARLSFSKD